MLQSHLLSLSFGTVVVCLSACSGTSFTVNGDATTSTTTTSTTTTTTTGGDATTSADTGCPSGQVQCDICGTPSCYTGGCPALACVADTGTPVDAVSDSGCPSGESMCSGGCGVAPYCASACPNIVCEDVGLDAISDAITSDACAKGSVECNICGSVACYSGETCPVDLACIADSGVPPKDAVSTDASTGEGGSSDAIAHETGTTDGGCPTGDMECNICGTISCYSGGSACPQVLCVTDAGLPDGGCPNGGTLCSGCGAPYCSTGACPEIACLADAIVGTLN